MGAAAVFAIIEKGLTIIPILLQAGSEIGPLVQRLIDMAKGGANGSVTQADLDALEADLDQALADFNTPMA